MNKRNMVLILLCLMFVLPRAQETSGIPGNFFSSLNPPVESSEKGGGFKFRYVLFSLVLPGAGEWVLGSKGLAKIFFGSEVALWAGYLGTQNYIGVLEDNYQAYAAVHAGVNTADKSEQYWIDVGNADDIFQHNHKRLLQRNLEGTYTENEFYRWVWDSRQSRDQYNELRFKQHDWKRRANILIGGMVLNRLISAVDVIRLLRKQGKESSTQTSRIFFDYRNTVREGEVYCLNLIWQW
ncbi:MAG: hypothetical protein Kow0042_18550 [Calditrichia bacterium]